jgi:predicted dehydrogenase
VAVVSRRPQEGWKAFSSLKLAMSEFNPERVIIANETHLHEETLREVQAATPNCHILVEKPLFAQFPADMASLRTEHVFVAYHLRFHPLIEELVRRTGNTPIVGWNSYVGQNLASWRSRDYRESYSSNSAQGGGALRDLSHEVDMLRFIGGEIEFLAAHGGHFSNLETDADDTYSLLLKATYCSHANVSLNCVDHLGQRRLTVHTSDETFELDFIAGTWRDKSGTRILCDDRNAPYMSMVRDFLNHSQKLCSFEEGLQTLQLIVTAEKESK